MKFKKWFWGMFFLLAGAIIIVNQLGYMGNINVFTLVFTILLISIIIKSISHRNFSGVLFPLAFIGIMYKDELGITNLTPWPILLTALFLSIGLTIIFGKHNTYRKYCKNYNEGFDEVINIEDNNVVEVRVNFGSSIKYVNTKNFQKGIFDCSFGAIKVYFDNAEISEKGAEIILNCAFSGSELYIPKEWEVINNVSTSLGGVEEKNIPHTLTKKGPKLILKGNVSFAGVEIIYI